MLKFVVSLTRFVDEYAEAVIEAKDAGEAKDIFWQRVDTLDLDWRDGAWCGKPDVAEVLPAEDVPGVDSTKLTPLMEI